MMAPKASPVNTSNTECCLMNIVDNTMEKARMPEPVLMSFPLAAVHQPLAMGYGKMCAQ